MSEADTRRWSLKVSETTMQNAVTTDTLRIWARQGTLLAGRMVSLDRISWVPVESIPELEMNWFIEISESSVFGPVNHEAALKFIQEGRFPVESNLTQTPKNPPNPEERQDLPSPKTCSSYAERLQENQTEINLLKNELQLREKQIKTLQKQQENIPTQTDMSSLEQKATIENLTEEVKTLRSEKEKLVQREAEFQQRINTLETAIRAANDEKGKTKTAPLTDAVIFGILQQESLALEKTREVEQKFIDQLKELTRQRDSVFAERLQEIYAITGQTPEDMRRRSDAAGVSRIAPNVASVARTETSVLQARITEAQHDLQSALNRETELQKKLIAMESKEHQLLLQVEQAQRRTIDTLGLDEKLHDTMQALQNEKKSRESEQKENAEIQQNLIRRIEELEHLINPNQVRIDKTGEISREESHKTAFDWLRRK